MSTLELVLVVIAAAVPLISCECRQSYMTICDSFEDIKDHDDKETWSELMIGSDRPESDAKLTPANLMKINLQEYNQLTTLMIIRRINQLESTHGFQCTYYTSPLKSMILYGNELKRIEPYHFPVVPLKKLSLVNNKIEAVKDWAFRYHEIENLDLSDNLMEVVERGSLSSTNATKIITIKNNKLSHIEPGSLPSSLRILNLERNNLRYIQNEVLGDLLKLEALTLANNKLNEMPKISHLKNLKIFDISSNAISTVDSGIFEQMNDLELLDLSHNEITNPSILGALLAAVKQPKLTISLAVNRLGRLNLTNVSFQDQTLVLFGNPWDCNGWDDLKKQLIKHESKCDLEFFSSGKLPYCINYRSASYVFSSLWEQDIDRLHSAVKENAKLIGCKLAPKRYHLLDPVRFGCVA